MALLLRKVSFRFDTAEAFLFRELSIDFHGGWTGILGANGSGKTTLLRLAAGELSPCEGQVLRRGRVLLCEQRTEEMPQRFAAFLGSGDPEVFRLRGMLGIEDAWGERWHSLSFGERKRVQVALALWEKPESLLLDEPTNHLDGAARRLLGAALATYDGVGLLVSHDRELLDGLCRRCLFLGASGPVLYPGNYTEASAQKARDEETARAVYLERRRACKRLEAEQRRRLEEASRSDRRRSKRDLDRHDSDGRARIDLARVSGMDGQAGRLKSQLDGRLRHLREEVREVRPPKERELRFWLSGAVSPRNRILDLPEDRLALGGGRTLHLPRLELGSRDRVALVGPNGSGKSTLVRHLLRRVQLPPEQVLFLPQELSGEQLGRLASEVALLSSAERGLVMTVVSCLGSRPESLLAPAALGEGADVPVPSPGEARKLQLALGVIRVPSLVVLDEPTNHLDLPAVELLENALASCPCTMLLVSHDRRFLEAVTESCWRITLGPDGNSLLEKGAAALLRKAF
jgi:macrolide transport system ATP-binding/permease protein